VYGDGGRPSGVIGVKGVNGVPGEGVKLLLSVIV